MIASHIYPLNRTYYRVIGYLVFEIYEITTRKHEIVEAPSERKKTDVFPQTRNARIYRL